MEARAATAVNRLVKKSVLIGAYVTGALVVAEVLLAQATAFRGAAQRLAVFLVPGMAFIQVFGANRIDDVGFRGAAMIVNWLLYSSVCFPVLWLIDRRSDRSEKDGSK